jgi:16S rRNA (cytosine1402-N4)-methyltransferase
MTTPNPTYHAPVLLKECLEMMQIPQGGVFVDATFGGGGHSAHILSKMAKNDQLYSFDQDEDAWKNALEKPFNEYPGFHFVQTNFRFMKRMLRSEGVRLGSVSAILADLGVSSYQLDTPERGFSYRFEAPLDMRMNTTEGQSAADILNTYSADQLQQILSIYGEVRNARTLALACLDARAGKAFKTTGDLVRVCEKNAFGERWRYLSQVFQALRMEVNDETGALSDFLQQSHEMLKPGGRLVVITYHSIEDRLVKNYMKSGNAEGEVDKDFYGNITRPWTLVNKKPIEPGSEEISVNPRSRSAKLRVAEKNEPKS